MGENDPFGYDGRIAEQAPYRNFEAAFPFAQKATI
jgi:hypothetical protein